MGYTGAVVKLNRLLSIIDAFPGTRIVLLGDLVLDRFILGTPKRISREAPIIILRHEGQEDIPGGGANCLANLASLGVDVQPVGFTGIDEAGDCLIGVLQERGIDTESILRIASFRTPMKVRILGGGASSLKHQVARYDVEDHLLLDADLEKKLVGILRKRLENCDALALSDYGYGSIPGNLLDLVGKRRPRWICLDSRRRMRSFTGVDAATPNLGELEAWVGKTLRGDRDVARAAEDLRNELGARFILATRGNRGMTLVETERKPTHLPVFGTDEVADVTGAGDTVLATLTAALAAGAHPEEAATLANIAGGLVVMKLGTATITAAELRKGVLAWGEGQ